MVNEGTLVNLLTKRLDAHQRDLATKRAEYEQLGLEIDSIRELIQAIRVVIDKEFKTNDLDSETVAIENSTSAIENDKQPPINERPNLFGNDESEVYNNGSVIMQRRRVGLKNTAREFFSELPSNFTKYDVTKLLLRKHTELSEINENTLSGVMRDLVEKELAVIDTPSLGTLPQIYRKV